MPTLIDKFEPRKRNSDWILLLACIKAQDKVKGSFKIKLDSFIQSFDDWFDEPYFQRQKLENKLKAYDCGHLI